MIIGAHVLLYSNDAEADRKFIRNVLGFTAVDAGHGWLIFAMPPSELALHPLEGGPARATGMMSTELYLMCDDLQAEMAALGKKGVRFSAVEEARWGSVTRLRLPGGGQIGLYQPKHPMAVGTRRA